MYRKNIQPKLASAASNNDRSDIDISSGKLISNPIRTTSQILNLFKKSTQDPNKSVLKEVNGPITSNASSIKQDSPAAVIPAKKIVFNVVMGKISARKHKKWDDDGVLEVTGKRAVLKDVDGKVKDTKIVDPENLVEGFRMYMDNKEIEIIDRVAPDGCSLKQSKEIIQEPPLKKIKTLKTDSFLPVVSSSKRLKLTFEPLVMPSLNTSKEWLEQDEFRKEEEVSVDSCLVNVLRPHQRHGIVFLYECVMGGKASNYFGAILADEMGLGKTLQCITLIWTLLKKGPYGQPTVKRVLIVTPSSLCNNWNKEFNRWLGTHRICPYIVNTKNKPKDFTKYSRNSVMIISYDMLIRSQEDIEQIDFDLMICDEGHRLKNSDIKSAKFLQNMNCKKRVLLTGTPVQNDLQEFFALLDFVNPGILGSNQDFKKYYENPIVASRCPNADGPAALLGEERAKELHEQTKCFILRRTQDTINKYLPSKHEIIVFCRLSDQQVNLYSHVTDTWFASDLLPGNDVPHLTIITALKKICNHSTLFTSEKNDFLKNNFPNAIKIPATIEDKYCGKVTIIQTLMKNLKTTDEKLVLISYYTQTLNLLETVCKKEGLNFLRLDGSTQSSKRSKIVEQFNTKTNNSKVFLLSAKAGGVGLNLPGASRLVLFDSDWNPASDAQAMARIWREGQKKPVYLYRLITTGTIEEKIFQRQISKAGLSETVVDRNSLASLKLSNSELKDLFTLTTETDCLTHDLMKCSCNGEKKSENSLEKSDLEDDREYQFHLDDAIAQQNLTINQLLNWEHYKQLVPNNIMRDIMLSEAADKVSFILKYSTLR